MSGLPPLLKDTLGVAYRPLSLERLIEVIEDLPEVPSTRLSWLRRLLWWGADRAGAREWNRLSCWLHDSGWWLP